MSKRVKTFKELKKLFNEGKKLIWNDPDPIDGNDYTISWIENDFDHFDSFDPILIQYNGGQSEAQIFLHEIIIE
jgi:hypothetical protein